VERACPSSSWAIAAAATAASILAAARAAGRLNSGNPFLVSNPPAFAFLAWAAVWILGLLALTIWSFRKREV